MDDNQKFMRMFGGIFFSVGVVMLFISVIAFIFGGFFVGGICFLLGAVFGAIGGGILINLIKQISKAKDIEKHGIKFEGKIYGYIDDKSFTMNGDYLVNTKVHYFDKDHIEREGIIQTRFTKGTSDFPIGATIDIIEYKGKYTWVPGSVRFTHIDGEEELLDDKPLAPDKIKMSAVSCQSCGVSFTAVSGYAAKCPYCGAATNVK